MIWIYLAALIFGGAFLVPMLLGGLGDVDIGDAELDVGDVDVDVDADVDADTGSDGADVVGGGSPLGAIFASLLSFRTIVFFSSFFGGAGLVFGALGYSAAATLGSAVLVAVLAAVINSMLFGLLRSSENTSQVSNRMLEGRPATVVLPIETGRRGRIRIRVGDQTHYLVADPVDHDTERFEVGASVLVVNIENGTAQVMPLPELE